MFERPRSGERALLVRLGIDSRVDPEDLREFSALAESAGATVLGTVTGHRARPDPKFFVGTGKAEEIRAKAEELEAEVVLFDHALSPSQERNLEKLTGRRVLDRNGLILDIFAQRARSHEGKLQVELAQLKHLATRLVRGWTHLERQQGGIGMRGPGETQIETDRRIILTKIALLKENLKDIDQQMSTQRKNRGKMVRVALVGYTNVGKSTLMNLLCKSDIFAENKLFATLDTTVRKLVIDNLPFLLSDTVGFIRKLPHHLVQSYKTTLDEVREADLLLHVIDISHPNFEEQLEVVNKTLQEIDPTEKTMILVFNKIDAFTYTPKEEDDLGAIKRENVSLEELKATWLEKMNGNCIFISAREKQNIDDLKKLMYERVKTIHIQRFPYNDFLFQNYTEE